VDADHEEIFRQRRLDQVEEKLSKEQKEDMLA